MVDREALYSDEYFKNLNTITGPKASLLQPEQERLVPMVKLYLGQINGKWIFTNVMGVLCYVIDRQTKCQYLKIHDANSLDLLFQFEVFYNFFEHIKLKNDHFYYFEVEKGYIGLSFLEAKQAKLLYHLIQIKSKQFQFSEKELKKGLKKQKVVLGQKSTNKFMGFMQKQFSDFKNYLGIDQNEHQNAQVQSSSHKFMIKRDPQTGQLDIDTLPQKIKAEITKSGITKEQLLNPNVQVMVEKLIIEEMMLLNTQPQQASPEKPQIPTTNQKEIPQPPSLPKSGPKLPLNKTQNNDRQSLLSEIRRNNLGGLKKVEVNAQKPLSSNPHTQLMDQIKNQQNKAQLKHTPVKQEVKEESRPLTLADKLRQEMMRIQAQKRKQTSDDESDSD